MNHSGYIFPADFAVPRVSHGCGYLVAAAEPALISLPKLMRIMFVISIVALLALLWASISIASHVRRARRRHRSLKPFATPPYPLETTPAHGHADFTEPPHTTSRPLPR